MTAALHAPWRMPYLRSIGTPDDAGCFLCLAAAAGDDQQRRQRLVLWQTQWSVVLMNRFPYTNGHLLIAPRKHKADLDELSDPESLDVQVQSRRAVRLLKRAVSAQGFNLGINLGRVAGAGVPGHLHQHVVPRWGGDVNFINIVGEVRIIPEAVSTLYEELIKINAALPADESAPVP